MQALSILFSALFTVAVATALGASLLRGECEDLGLRFVSGAAALSVAIFCLCAAQLAYPLAFALLGIAALFPWRKSLVRSLGNRRLEWGFHNYTNYLLLLAFSLYFILYFFN